MFLWESFVSKQPKAFMTGHQQLVNHVYFSPDGQWIASASFDRSVRLWNGTIGKFVGVFRGHVGPVCQTSWSANSWLLLSGSEDSTLKVWDIRSMKLKQNLPGHADEVVKLSSVVLIAFIDLFYLLLGCFVRYLNGCERKLSFEPEYAGNSNENSPPNSALQIPWAWLVTALCLLQEVGEVKLVRDIGQVAIQHPDAKPYIHYILVSMALAECATAKIGFEKNKVSQGFEAIARAQSLVKRKKCL